jgi:hypothetical protein
VTGNAPVKMADNLVASSAAVITRRRLLRNAGTVALGTALGFGFLGRVDKAWAVGTCYCPYGQGPCGPSPLCTSNCNGAGECGSFCRRSYNKFNCPCNTTPPYDNCWTEYCNCGTCWAGTYRCCDCCGSGGGGMACGCGTACICRSVIGSC